MADAPKLPRGALTEATAAVVAVARHIGATCDITEPTQARPIARAALEAAVPAISRSALRDAARLMLVLDDLDAGRICPACWGKTTRVPRILGGSWLDFECEAGHTWPRGNRGPYGDLRTSVRRLARGEQLPGLEPKETPDA